MITLQTIPNDQHLRPKRPSRSLEFGFVAERGREGRRVGFLALDVNYRGQLGVHTRTSNAHFSSTQLEPLNLLSVWISHSTHLFTIYYLSGSILDIWDTSEQKRLRFPSLRSLHSRDLSNPSGPDLLIPYLERHRSLLAGLFRLPQQLLTHRSHKCLCHCLKCKLDQNPLPKIERPYYLSGSGGPP